MAPSARDWRVENTIFQGPQQSLCLRHAITQNCRLDKALRRGSNPPTGPHHRRPPQFSPVSYLSANAKSIIGTAGNGALATAFLSRGVEKELEHSSAAPRSGYDWMPIAPSGCIWGMRFPPRTTGGSYGKRGWRGVQTLAATTSCDLFSLDVCKAPHEHENWKFLHSERIASLFHGWILMRRRQPIEHSH